MSNFEMPRKGTTQAKVISQAFTPDKASAQWNIILTGTAHTRLTEFFTQGEIDKLIAFDDALKAESNEIDYSNVRIDGVKPDKMYRLSGFFDKAIDEARRQKAGLAPKSIDTMPESNSADVAREAKRKPKTTETVKKQPVQDFNDIAQLMKAIGGLTQTVNEKFDALEKRQTDVESLVLGEKPEVLADAELVNATSGM